MAGRRAARRKAGGRKRRSIQSKRFPGDGLTAWPRIVERLRRAQRIALFLDLDGTLVPFRDRPEKVRVPRHVNDLLERLAGHKWMTVTMVSGRRVTDLMRLISAKGVRLYGIHGAERVGKARTINRDSRAALTATRFNAGRLFRDIPKIRIEDKGLSFAVHYRGAMPMAGRIAKERLLEIMKPFRALLRLQEGDRVWEVIPSELRGKGATVQSLLSKLPRKTLGIYMGDDATDEPAFRVLRRGITIHVGRRWPTKANFHLANPPKAIRFLQMLERELP